MRARGHRCGGIGVAGGTRRLLISALVTVGAAVFAAIDVEVVHSGFPHRIPAEKEAAEMDAGVLSRTA